MILEKYGQQFLIGHVLGIKPDLHGLGMASPPGAHVLVGWILRRATGVADGGRGHALYLPECILDTPETACCKRCLRHEWQTPFLTMRSQSILPQILPAVLLGEICGDHHHRLDAAPTGWSHAPFDRIMARKGTSQAS